MAGSPSHVPPELPPELLRPIFIQAVTARTLKRALRLRLVCRLWNHETTEAILCSGILDSRQWHLTTSPFWPRYLARKLQQSPSQLSRPLSILHRVARYIVSFRAQGARPTNYDTLVKNHIQTICHHDRQGIITNSIRDPLLFTPHRETQVIRDSDPDFLRTLLTVAAATNEVDLAHYVGCTTEVKKLMMFDCSALLGTPIKMAAFYGHVEVLKMLMSYSKDPETLLLLRKDGLQAASRNNQIGTLEVVLGPGDYESLRSGLLKAVRQTKSTAMFHEIYSRCKDILLGVGQSLETDTQQLQLKFLSRHFRIAAAAGDLEKMKYLVWLGASPRCANGPEIAFITNAALRGYTNVMAYLLRHGAQIGSRSLEAASKHGNVNSVRLLLEYSTPHSLWLGSSLLDTVEREHEEVLRLLLSSFNPPKEELWKQALDAAKAQGLDSMVEILEEYEDNKDYEDKSGKIH